MTGGDLYSSPSVEPVLSHLSCNGSEDKLIECYHTPPVTLSCSSTVVVCQGMKFVITFETSWIFA